MNAPILSTAAGLLLTHGPLATLTAAPTREFVKVLAEAARLLGVGLPLTIGLGRAAALILAFAAAGGGAVPVVPFAEETAPGFRCLCCCYSAQPSWSRPSAA